MKTLTQFFPSWTETLGWTLLNSIWQAFAILIILKMLLRLIPSKFSQSRYVTASIAMGLILMLNAASFIYLKDTNSVTQTETVFTYQGVATNFTSSQADSFSIEQMFSGVRDFFANHMPLIFLGWLIGAILFSLRLISGWWYISRLKSEAVMVPDVWREKLQYLAASLGIDRMISLAQSTRIHSPIVIGFLKPIVLVPAGMLSGLSTEQIETIIIHELAHIRRHDYIINLIQSFIEALYFFNPFIWVISNLIRREREYCCDDTVIKKHGSSLAYAHALAQLEEVRLSKSVFALSLAEDKNQLLNRIKRIMEKSAKNYSGRDKMIPAVLLVIGLFCASWLSVSTGKQISGKESQQTSIVADTTKKKLKSARSSRKTVITIDENGKAHEETIVEYNGDEALRNIIPMIPMEAPVPAIPSIPSIDIVLAPIPAPRELNTIHTFGAFDLNMDSIPFSIFSYRQSQDLDEFSKAFEEKFREQFADFYKTHGKDFDNMMKELEEQFANNFNENNWSNFQNLSDDQMEKAMEALRNISHEDVLEAEINAHKAAAHMEESQENHKEDLEKLERDMLEHSEDFKKLEDDLRHTEMNLKAFEKELKENLIKDGYIQKDDELKTIDWDDSGTIKINGKKINDTNRKKYNDLHRKYFEKTGHFRYVE